MNRPRGNLHTLFSFSLLALASGMAAYAPRAPLALVAAGLLAWASALSLRRAWRVHILGAMLLCLGATTTAGAGAALVDALHRGAPRQLTPEQWDAVWDGVAMDLDLSADDLVEAYDYARYDFEFAATFSYYEGRADAKRDLASGILRLHAYGLPAWSAEEYDRIFLEEYGVEHEWVAGCVVTTRLVEHARGYNEVMSAAIEQRFGADIFDRVEARARTEERARVEAYRAQARRIDPTDY